MNNLTWVRDNVLGFGNIDACELAGGKDWAVVHACKYPCHRNFVGYKSGIDKSHPHYLSAEEGGHLYLNMIDPPVPLFQKESFDIFFDFIDRTLNKKPVIIHCNQGMSRAPSLTLLVMAKRLGLLPDASYSSARAAFEQNFTYEPGGGISQFLEENWLHLGQVDHPGHDAP